MTERITSTANPRIKGFAKLKTARERQRTGRFLIEGSREVERAAAAGVAIETLLVCHDLLTTELPDLGGTVQVMHLGREPHAKVAVRKNPPGLIAVARQFNTGLASLNLGDPPLVLIAQGVEKPGNLGAMMRTADAGGADAFVVADKGTDVFNPNVVRASQGSLFSVPIGVASAAEVIEWVSRHGLSVVGGYPAAPSDLWDVPMTGALAVLVGAEDLGISKDWDGIANPVRIPMAGAADSLNASVSAALLLFEAVRQRRTGQHPTG